MVEFASIFFNFELPTPTTWFYFSLLLAVALFFKFSRLLSVRNWDVLTLFLLVPGLLLILEARASDSPQLRWFGYLWLLGGSGYFLTRCLVDLALVRRPALSPNLNPGGLAWLAGALFVSLLAVAVSEPSVRPEQNGAAPAPVDQVERQINREAAPTKWVEPTLAILCHLAVVAGLIFVGWRHYQDVHGGMAAATFYLLLPYTFLLLPYSVLHIGQWQHALPMALIVWAVASFRLPTLAGLLLGLAAGGLYFPALLAPVWYSFYWRRGAGRFAAAFLLAAGLSLAATGTVLWLQGELYPSLQSAVTLSDWQAWKVPTTESFWQGPSGTGVHWAYRIPVFIAYLAFVLTTAFWPMPKNLGHVLALSAAILIGLQFWYADQGGIYVLWYLPLLLLLVFRPNLADRRPAVIQAETDWLARLGRVLKRWTARLVRSPEPLARVR
ncbi:MAG TPA: hypothetical protein VG013_02615 [Gemmataceae bacterium]|jgi:hypothetical protein|nr:hypothetical protein [Gemmataceae bacterium]